MSDHDSSSSIHQDSATLRKYDVTVTTTTLSASLNITTILSWVKDELEPYVEHGQLPSIEDLDTSWEDGRAFLCLAHSLYPTSFDTTTIFNDLMSQPLDKTDVAAARSTYAFSVFNDTLDITPPHSIDPPIPIPLYLAQVRQAYLFLNPSSAHPSSITSHNDNNDNTIDTNDPWQQRTNAVLSAIQQVRQQLLELVFHPSSRDDPKYDNHRDLFSNNNNNNGESSDINSSSDAYEDTDPNSTTIKVTEPARSRTTSGWEEDLGMMEQQLQDLHHIMDDYHSWTKDNINSCEGYKDGTTLTQMEKEKRRALIQSVNGAYESLQEYLEQDQQVLAVFRKRALFTQATAPIRQDLDWVQAEMLKTTTTDNGIKELESRVRNAGILLQQLKQQYSDGQCSIDLSSSLSTSTTDNQLQEDEQQINTNRSSDHGLFTDDGDTHTFYAAEVDALVKRYQLVQSWVDDVRIWFVEAQRIRQWIGERIDILENSTIPDGILSHHLTLTADQVEDLNTTHDALEKEVELFDKEDMSRLRIHVKDLTTDATKDKDLR
ncbi:uncharacterized protein BX664DRAFT_352880 [Halteromyces radiatus]|uniref:uncharacterized protein n=1 Tax=Halteromyces radiatus TaxID=101107 RepID=UPI00221E4E49|nr:uncharacterized protein BX664DRAFT_352880 [Halteromyces radiatus]KAI8081781.1 hypothetical protein BX664DRAFT_352880 [Halteromyces radiatus]